MSRGPGCRQRVLLGALNRVGPSGAVRVAPPSASRSEAVSCRAAARRLVLAGRARAIYLRVLDARGRSAPVLHLVTVDSPLEGDAWCRSSRSWVSPPPLAMLSLPARLQGPVLSGFSGVEVSVSTAHRIARAYREAHGAAA